MNFYKFVTTTALLFLFAPAVLIFSQSAEEKLMNVSIYGGAENVEMEIQMAIHVNGSTKERTLEAFLSKSEEKKKVLLHIVSPAYLNRMKFLSVEEISGRTNKWLKTSQVVRRLSEKNYGENLFGSTFTVEDLSGFNSEEYHVSDLGKDRIKGNEVSVLEIHPKNTFGNRGKKVLYIDETENILIRADFYDEKGDLYKQYNLESKQKVEGVTFPEKCSMELVGENEKTVIEFKRIDIKESIPARYFNKANL